MADLAVLQQTLGVSFNDPSLLEQALIHSSYINENPNSTSNERLEFLGDAILGLVIAESAVNLFLVTLAYRMPQKGVGQAPIETAGTKAADVFAMVDPLPQALVLTSIVIGLSTLALAVAICLRLYDRYRTYDITEIKRLRG